MRKPVLAVMTAILTLTLATAATAADPIIGTWKLNMAKSQLGTGVKAPMKEQTNVVSEVNADQYAVTVAGMGLDGSAYSYKSTFPKQGGAPVGAEGVSAVLTVIGPGDWCFTTLQNGKQNRVAHVVVSKDGKTAMETDRNMDATGKITEMLLVYDKQ